MIVALITCQSTQWSRVKVLGREFALKYELTTFPMLAIDSFTCGGLVSYLR